MGLKGMWMDEQTVRDLRRLARLVGGYLGTFIVGGLIALVYSHTVLHDAKNWRIDYLEEQLEALQSAQMSSEIIKEDLQYAVLSGFSGSG